MNTYETEFFATCPVNAIRIKYLLRIESPTTIRVEDILAAVEQHKSGFQEDIADQLASLGGVQTLIANHHGVTITTERP